MANHDYLQILNYDLLNLFNSHHSDLHWMLQTFEYGKLE
jgi:hypothetical protein